MTLGDGQPCRGAQPILLLLELLGGRIPRASRPVDQGLVVGMQCRDDVRLIIHTTATGSPLLLGTTMILFITTAPLIIIGLLVNITILIIHGRHGEGDAQIPLGMEFPRVRIFHGIPRLVPRPFVGELALEAETHERRPHRRTGRGVAKSKVDEESLGTFRK